MAIRLDEARFRLLKMYGELSPSTNNTYNIGTNSLKFANIYATTFHGALNGNAATATALTTSAGSASQPIYFSNGKPVAVTLNNTCNNLLNALDTGSSTPVDADYYISQYVNGGTTTTTYHRRPMSALYSYIKGKAEGTWNNNISGNAATATKLATARTIQINLASTSGASFNGAANITPGVTGILAVGNGGTGANNRKTAITNLGVFGLYSREDIGTSPNFDNPGVNGLFEMREKAETTGETGTKPFDGYAPFISLRYSNTMFQLAGTNDSGFYIRGKQAGNPTLTSVAWQKLLTSNNWSDYAAAKSHSHSYLSLGGGTLTGKLVIGVDSDVAVATANSGSLIIGSTTGAHIGIDGNEIMAKASGTTAGILYLNNEGGKVQVGSGGLYGAVWNDYAEFRSAESIQPGRVVREAKDGIMKLTTERLMPACEIISDTFGFAIGETDECKTPIAATGRVLAYTYEDRYSFELGDAVCSGPNGTVSKMTRQELMMYPERMIGTVSEIPEYKIWGSGNVEVDGRIWIRIK